MTAVSADRARTRRWALVAAAITGGWAALVVAPAEPGWFFAVFGIEVALWGASAALAARAGTVPPAAVLWIAAVAVRVLGLAHAPWLEDDWYRYLWDGFRLVATGNPYGEPPAASFTDPGVPDAFVPILSGINHPWLATIYGPTLEYLFGLAYLVQPAALWPLKALLIAADLALIALLGRAGSPRAQCLYALCPLVVLEIAFHAHADGLGAVLAFGAAAAVAGGRRTGAGALLALAFGAKFWALALAPWILRSRRAVAAFVIVVAALYAPFIAGGDFGAAALSAFGRDWAFNAPLYRGLAAALGPTVARAALGAAAVALWAALAWATRRARWTPGDLAFGIPLLLAPVVNPWYLLWVLPFAALRPTRTAWVAAAVLALSYAHGLFVGGGALAPYQVAPWALAVEWGAIGLALAADLRARLGPSAGGGRWSLPSPRMPR